MVPGNDRDLPIPVNLRHVQSTNQTVLWVAAPFRIALKSFFIVIPPDFITYIRPAQAVPTKSMFTKSLI